VNPEGYIPFGLGEPSPYTVTELHRMIDVFLSHPRANHVAVSIWNVAHRLSNPQMKRRSADMIVVPTMKAQPNVMAKDIIIARSTMIMGSMAR
jgi:hypothetical protein